MPPVMRSMKTLLIGLTIIASLVACASIDPPDTKARAWDDNDYVTGSNLPRRKTSFPGEANSMSREDAEEMMRSRPAPIMPGGMK